VVILRVAINGFGRIGRNTFRALLNEKKINCVAINDLTDIKTLAYLLKYDSIHGTFNKTIKIKNNNLIVNNKTIQILSEKDPSKLPWKKLKIDVVIESTGFFATKKDAEKHLKAGAKKVIISANYKGNQDIKTLINGVNLNTYNKKTDNILCKGSCTTTCLTPLVKVLHDNFEIESGFLTTVHAVTTSQRILDAPHKKLREGRSLLNNLIPTTTGAAFAVTRVIPELKGKIDGMAIRVPVQDGSIVDFTCIVKKKTTVEEVNEIFKKASEGKFKGIIQYTEEPLTGVDIIGNTHSAIFDSQLTKVNNNFIKILAWYDNEYGYSKNLVDIVKILC